MSIDEKINLAITMCSDDYIPASHERFNKIYPFATENISGYIKKFDLKDRSLFTVGSSADQALSANLAGANQITVHDICPLSKEYADLKMAAMPLINRREFLTFFHNSKFNSSCFNITTYIMIRELLNTFSEESCYFWDQLFIKYSNGKIIRNKLFAAEEYETRVITKTIPYLINDEYYQILAHKITNANINFEIGNVFDYNSDIKYNNIWLSNIGKYYNLFAMSSLFERLLNNLSEEGKMLIAYLYDTDLSEPNYVGKNGIYNIYYVLKLLPESFLDSFIGMSGYKVGDPTMKDSIITHTKKNNNKA